MIFPTTARTSVHSRTTPVVKVKGPSTGPLWALVGALFFAFAGLAWWSFQQISLMEQQLVATQESFARISEEAAGRLQDISGKVVASQSNVNTGSEALKLQIKQLESKLQDQSKQLESKLQDQSKQQQGVLGQTSDLDKRLAQMTAQATEQQTANAQLQAQVKALSGELAALKNAPDDTSQFDAQLKSLGADIVALKKQGNPSAAIERLEQDMIVLKKPTGQPPGRHTRWHQHRRVRRLPRPGHPQHQHPAGADPESAATAAHPALIVRCSDGACGAMPVS